jgi:hypothetical protein
MPGKPWTDQRERPYEQIKQGLLQSGRGADEAKEIAARTVNKQRADNGQAKTAGERNDRELYAQAKARGIAGRSTMSKEELPRRLAS